MSLFDSSLCLKICALVLAGSAVACVRPADSLLQTLQDHVDWATLGASGAPTRMDSMPSVTSSGMGCSPARVNRRQPHFNVELPPRKDDRHGVLVVLLPDGSMRIVYVSYNDPDDDEDVILTSSTMDWRKVRTTNRFTLNARSFDAIYPDGSQPRPVFVQPGIYQFVLVNSIDRPLLAVNQDHFRAKAGCVIQWQP